MQKTSKIFERMQSSGASDNSGKAKLPYSKPVLRHIPPDTISTRDRLTFCTIKYMYVNDAFAKFRDNFVHDAFDRSTVLKYRLLFDSLPRTFERADIVVVGGNDFDRLASFIRVNQPILHHVPVIALGQTLAPRRRADLLNLGYDDVLNVKSCSPEEFGARAMSIYERYRITEAKYYNDGIVDPVIRKACNYEKLTFSQKKILRALIESPGKFCTYDKLSKIASRDYLDLSPVHLRVLIHSIRQHLSPGYEISSVYGEGYRLTGPESNE